MFGEDYGKDDRKEGEDGDAPDGEKKFVSIAVKNKKKKKDKKQEPAEEVIEQKKEEQPDGDDVDGSDVEMEE